MQPFHNIVGGPQERLDDAADGVEPVRTVSWHGEKADSIDAVSVGAGQSAHIWLSATGL